MPGSRGLGGIMKIDRRRVLSLFAWSAVVPTAEDAPLIDKLVAWTGRKP